MSRKIAVLCESKEGFHEFLRQWISGQDVDKFKYIGHVNHARAMVFSEVITVGDIINDVRHREIREYVETRCIR